MSFGIYASSGSRGGGTGPQPVSNLYLGPHRHLVWAREGSTWGPIGLDVNTKVEAMGATVVRVDTSWDGHEPTQGQFVEDAWGGKLTQGLMDLRDRNIQVILVVNDSPRWATGQSSIRYLPTDPASVAGVAKFLAETFSPANGYTNVLGVEYYNEPNLTSFDLGGPRPAHYADCLKVFYDAVKASGNPGLRVAKTGMAEIAVSADGSVTDLRNHYDTAIYERVAAAGWGYRPWDVFAVHCYPGTNPPSAISGGNSYWLLDHLRYLVAEMGRRGDDSPIWITEGGYSAHDNTQLNGTSPPSWQTGVTVQQRRDYTIGHIRRIVADFPQVEAAIFYNDWAKGNLAQASTHLERHEWGYGILDHLRAPKDIYYAMRDEFAAHPVKPPEGASR